MSAKPAILSAAGRHLAAHLSSAKFIEGSYSTLLLTEDIAVKPVVFGDGGQAPLIKGPGIGIEISKDVLEKYATKIIQL